MATNYYSKDSEIEIFPIGSRSPARRRLSELNLRNIIKALSDIQSFVLTPEFDPEKSLEFVIQGYYIQCKLPESIFKTTGNFIYAHVNLDPDAKYIVEKSGGLEGDYCGVYFTSSINFEESNFCILKKDDKTWVIPPESRRRFNSESLSQNFEILVVDGGNVDDENIG